METKFKSGDILFYICPFTFIIEKVQIDFLSKEEDGIIYYIESTGAYLQEQDLTNNLEEAKHMALNRLNKFYTLKLNEITNTSNPKFSEEDFNNGYDSSSFD